MGEEHFSVGQEAPVPQPALTGGEKAAGAARFLEGRWPPVDGWEPWCWEGNVGPHGPSNRRALLPAGLCLSCTL